MIVNISNRLKRENKRTMWGTGELRRGNQRDRCAWIFQRFSETSAKRMINPFLKKIGWSDV